LSGFNFHFPTKESSAAGAAALMKQADASSPIMRVQGRVRFREAGEAGSAAFPQGYGKPGRLQIREVKMTEQPFDSRSG
jgi:hypothetical protein